MCHEDKGLTTERDGHEVSLYVDVDKFHTSIHGEMDCIDCHADLAGTDFPHIENPAPVDCGMCHDNIAAEYTNSLHGKSRRQRGKAGARGAGIATAPTTSCQRAIPTPR